MRAIITLENSQASRLDAWAPTEKISRAEAGRRAVSLMLERDGPALQHALRDEWPE